MNSFGLGAIGEQAARAAFKKLDDNHNGKLDVSEAVKAFESIKTLILKANQQTTHQ